MHWPEPSLVILWLRICLTMQRTWVWSLVWKIPCAIGQLSLSLTLLSPHSRAHVPQLMQPTCLQFMLCNRSHPSGNPDTAVRSGPCSPQLEKARRQQWRPSAAKAKQTEQIKISLKKIVKRGPGFLKCQTYLNVFN